MLLLPEPATLSLVPLSPVLGLALWAAVALSAAAGALKLRCVATGAEVQATEVAGCLHPANKNGLVCLLPVHEAHKLLLLCWRFDVDKLPREEVERLALEAGKVVHDVVAQLSQADGRENIHGAHHFPLATR